MKQHSQHKNKLNKINPDPCWVPDNSEIEQGSGKKPDDDGVRKVFINSNKTNKNEQAEASTDNQSLAWHEGR